MSAPDTATPERKTNGTAKPVSAKKRPSWRLRENPAGPKGKLLCLVCEREQANLASHIATKHRLTVDAYRQRFRLHPKARVSPAEQEGLTLVLTVKFPDYDVKKISRITLVAARVGTIVSAELVNMPPRIRVI